MFHQKLFWLLVFLLPTQIGRHFWPEWSYVLGLRVDYLAPTVYLTDLLIIGILGLWFWEIRDKRYAIRDKLKRHWWILAVFIYLLVNSLLGQDPGAALYKFVKIVEFTLLGFYIAKTKPNVSRLASYLSLAVAYSSLIAITQFIKQASLGGIFWWLGERTFTVATPGIAKAIIGGRLLMRPYATFPHPNVLAGFILVAIILLLGSRGIYWILVFILALIGLVISFSRSAWIVGILVGLWLLVTHLRGEAKLRRHLGGGGILLMLLILSLFFYFAPQFSTEEAISQRVELIKIATQMIRSSPLAGIGLNNFIVRLPEFWTVQSIYWLQPVHNIFLLIAAEAGLVGLVVFLWFLFLTFKKLLITNNKQLLLLLSVVLILGLTDHYWLTLQQSQLLFTIILGLSWTEH